MVPLVSEEFQVTSSKTDPVQLTCRLRSQNNYFCWTSKFLVLPQKWNWVDQVDDRSPAKLHFNKNQDRKKCKSDLAPIKLFQKKVFPELQDLNLRSSRSNVGKVPSKNHRNSSRLNMTFRQFGEKQETSNWESNWMNSWPTDRATGRVGGLPAGECSVVFEISMRGSNKLLIKWTTRLMENLIELNRSLAYDNRAIKLQLAVGSDKLPGRALRRWTAASMPMEVGMLKAASMPTEYAHSQYATRWTREVTPRNQLQSAEHSGNSLPNLLIGRANVLRQAAFYLRIHLYAEAEAMPRHTEYTGRIHWQCG